MIAIASPATPQLGSLLPRSFDRADWRSPPKTFHRLFRTWPPRKISPHGRKRMSLRHARSFQIVLDRHGTRSTKDAGHSLKSP